MLEPTSAAAPAKGLNMTSTLNPHGLRTNRGSFGAYGGNGSLLLQKAKTHAARTSTPDSEALASSDEEHDNHSALSQSMHSVASTQPGTQPGPRRLSTSWLSEVQPRKMSIGAASHTSNGSQPVTPSGDPGPWGPSRGSASNNTYSAWNKATPVLAGVPQSPTSVLGPDEQPLRSPTLRDGGSIPFKFPESPQRKAVRSQSYSVGQMESEAAPAFTGRVRPPLPPLRHRPSQPSLLSEPPQNATSLSLLPEDEDDEESLTGSEQGVRLPPTYHAKPDLDSHGLLRQTTVRNAHAHPPPLASSPLSRNRQRLKSIPFGDSDYAIEEVEDTQPQDYGLNRAYPQNSLGRRFSEQLRSPEAADEEMLRDTKARWQSSLGFGGFGPEGAQSRRHSFADVPSYMRASRPGFPSLSKTYEEYDDAGIIGAGIPRQISPGQPHDLDNSESTTFLEAARSMEGTLVKEFDSNRIHAANYFNGVGPALKSRDYTFNTSAAVEDNPYAVPSVLQSSHKDLYMVSFKCARADVFYIPENTGLEVKKGDLVIVEGDRGIDLGTVTHAKVTWEEAKRLKDESVEQHYKWLMMFSRHNQSLNSGVSNPSGMFAASGGQHGSAVGGMGPEAPFAQAVALSLEEILRPKMIKRLAQNHEIHALREKEGNEAKAKRVCQQKTIEHNLPMEILDAEYQIDMKKLTFFYYAEAYINFNELVTDLFKMYKTRIWLSAVNPASFPAPSGAHGAHGTHGAHGFSGAGRTPVSTGGRRIHAPVTQPMSLGTSATTGFTGGLYTANDHYGGVHPAATAFNPPTFGSQVDVTNYGQLGQGWSNQPYGRGIPPPYGVPPYSSPAYSSNAFPTPQAPNIGAVGSFQSSAFSPQAFNPASSAGHRTTSTLAHSGASPSASYESTPTAAHDSLSPWYSSFSSLSIGDDHNGN